MSKEKVGVKFQVKNAEKLAADISKFGKQGEKVIKYTVVDTKRRSIPIVKENILERYNLQKRDLNDKNVASITTKSQERLGNINVGVVIRGRVLTIRRFGMTPKKPPGFQRLKKKERFVAKLKDGTFKTFSRKRKPYSISVEIKKGNKETFQPQGETRYFLNNIGGGGFVVPWQVEGNGTPEPLKTLSVPQMLGQVKDKTLDDIDEVYSKRFKYHYQRLIKKD